MGQFEGVNRVFRSELNAPVERAIQVDKTDKDRQREEKDERREDLPEDVVELHDEPESEGKPAKKKDARPA
ncbi:MAG TPA: hypothetical protein VNI20_07195, partial [Fimbriimonadaceae bacterium]|nr:hypothetical protein [Fimbriimonadaceae bacterium]